jgi:hypothetical protein
MRLAITFILFVMIFAPTASASIQDVELRLDTAIQYPNDRPVNIVVEGMAFEDDKPSLSKVEIKAEIRWANGTVMTSQESLVQPGIRTSITFSPINEVGRYYVFVSGEAGGVRSGTESQTMRITYAPQEYTAGFTDGGRFIVSPKQTYLNLTIQEFLDDGTSVLPGRVFKTNGSIVDITVPEGYLAIRYNVIDQNGWMNYERSDQTGLTVHGGPYVWLYGDLARIEPVSSLVRPFSIFVGVIGSLLIIVGCFNFFTKFREESLQRLKDAGLDNMPTWKQRRRDRQARERAERDYWDRRRTPDPYWDRRRF